MSNFYSYSNNKEVLNAIKVVRTRIFAEFFRAMDMRSRKSTASDDLNERIDVLATVLSELRRIEDSINEASMEEDCVAICKD